MRIAQDWLDYEILDTSSSEKLERWGDIILVRPDPQIIWNTDKKHTLWNSPHARYFRSSNGGGCWKFNKKVPDSWTISYKNCKFKVSPTGFKHTGLFPEQAVNWDYLIDTIKSEQSKRKEQISVLNLFAYTGGATMAAASAGAKVCHVDASKGMVNWAKENAVLSGLKDKPIRFIVDDCKKFVEREQRRGNKYDIIIMDPPSYGRGPSGEIWKLEDSIYDLIQTCVPVLSEKPISFLLNSYTTGLSASVMSYLLGVSLIDKFGGQVSSSEIGLPVKQSKLYLPCGSTAIWSNK